jgi:hypothetical protein
MTIRKIPKQNLGEAFTRECDIDADHRDQSGLVSLMLTLVIPDRLPILDHL